MRRGLELYPAWGGLTIRARAVQLAGLPSNRRLRRSNRLDAMSVPGKRQLAPAGRFESMPPHPARSVSNRDDRSVVSDHCIAVEQIVQPTQHQITLLSSYSLAGMLVEVSNLGTSTPYTVAPYSSNHSTITGGTQCCCLRAYAR
jgi:hypothetical protein